VSQRDGRWATSGKEIAESRLSQSSATVLQYNYLQYIRTRAFPTVLPLLGTRQIPNGCASFKHRRAANEFTTITVIDSTEFGLLYSCYMHVLHVSLFLFQCSPSARRQA